MKSMPGYGHNGAGLRLGALGALHASQEMPGQGKQHEIPAQTSWEDVSGVVFCGDWFLWKWPDCTRCHGEPSPGSPHYHSADLAMDICP